MLPLGTIFCMKVFLILFITSVCAGHLVLQSRAHHEGLWKPIEDSLQHVESFFRPRSKMHKKICKVQNYPGRTSLPVYENMHFKYSIQSCFGTRQIPSEFLINHSYGITSEKKLTSISPDIFSPPPESYI